MSDTPSDPLAGVSGLIPESEEQPPQEAVPSPETEDEIDVPEGAENPDAVRNLIKTERASAKAANRRARELEAQLRQRDEAERPLEDRLADATREAEQARLNTMRYEVAAETGLPLQLASRLTGSSKDELVADADKLKQLVGAPAPLVPPEGGVHQPPPAKGDPIAEHNNLLATLLSQRNAPGVATVPGRDPLAGLLPAPVED